MNTDVIYNYKFFRKLMQRMLMDKNDIATKIGIISVFYGKSVSRKRIKETIVFYNIN